MKKGEEKKRKYEEEENTSATVNIPRTVSAALIINVLTHRH